MAGISPERRLLKAHRKAAEIAKEAQRKIFQPRMDANEEIRMELDSRLFASIRGSIPLFFASLCDLRGFAVKIWPQRNHAFLYV